jgi:phosphoribosylanthranilate isomerase
VIVKICGITRLEDAVLAFECGASALGFVFWPRSPRFIDPSHARAIVARLPPFVTPVGVFVNQPCEHVNEVAARVGLSVVQLHGDETVEYASAIDRPVLKAMSLNNTWQQESEQWPSQTMMLIDAHDPVRRGGTGRTIDWTEAASVAARRRVMLAGGLTPENVAVATAQVNPFGIDVSSGVEASPGVKDAAKLRALFQSLL